MITDDDLILYHYRDGLDAAERARIGKALSEQPELSQRLQALVSRLDAAAALPEVSVPELTQRRWDVALERATRQDVTRDASTMRAARRWDFRWPAAAAAAAVAVVALVLYREPTTQVVTPSNTYANTAEASAYERGLKVHLENTEQQLAGLDSATPEQRTRLIKTIIAQNHIYALAAEKAGEPQLARVLRAFSPVLESMTHEGGDTSASIAQLSFELRVMQGRLSAGTGAPSNTTTL